MYREKESRVGNLLSDENFAVVTEYCCKNNVTPDVGLNQILSEWAEGDKFGRLKETPKSPNLSEIEQRLISIEKAVSRIENTVDDILLTEDY